MRWGVGMFAVVLGAVAGLWIGLPTQTAPAIEAQAVAVTQPTTTTTSTTPPPLPTPDAVRPFTGPFTVASVVAKSIAVHTAPDSSSVKTLSNPGTSTLPLVFLALSQRDGWLEVALPTRPNGSTGFVHAADVKLSRVTTQIKVEQSLRRLTVWDGDRLAFQTPVAVGKAKTPTPNGVYYVQGAAKMGNPRGAYGPYIVALSAHSEVYKTFAGGDGLVGIHGTNQPSLIGGAVSNGCIRLPNSAILEVARLVSPGTPVVVVP